MKIEVKSENGKIWSHIRQKWLLETPEERVRQRFLEFIVNEYGFLPEQMKEEESVTGRGSGQARADFIIWRTIKDKTDEKPPLIVAECKSDNVTIKLDDYHQGDHYARMANASFFVTHNIRETRFWRVRKDRMPGYLEEIENIPHADASDAEIEKIIINLKTFKEDEFADLLHQCHNVIRNREHLDPAAAFDEIAKILFIKTWVEREMRRKRQRQNLFTADWLDTQLGEDPLQELFRQTKEEYREDHIFDDRDRLNLKPATGREIVRLLEKYNLSDTSEDIKGIAFERFLGRTFRGEIGQFFTPRTILEFMVRMVEPKEGNLICDPASGSGGFLIRFFEIVREQILADVDKQYQTYVEKINAEKLPAEEKARLLREKYEELQTTINPRKRNSRLWHLANRTIYGCDANDRMARTSKMNMIMHGDGHGGIHHHNGFINVNGIFESRFDIVLTNPPFGANIEPSDRITDSDVYVSDEQYRSYIEMYGQAYKESQSYVQRAAENKASIASIFDLPKRGNTGSNKKTGKIKTELLFIERCLALLKPGGRLGIVLPEGVFNNPSLAYVREYCEDRAFIRAVISLPQETFYSIGATVKASLLFLQKFTEEEATDYETKRKIAVQDVEAKHKVKMEIEIARLNEEIEKAKNAHDVDRRRQAQIELREYEKSIRASTKLEARRLLKERFAYPVFFFDAEHVGLTATGDQDTCELFYKDTLGLPPELNTEETALEQYRRFRISPDPFIIDNDHREAV